MTDLKAKWMPLTRGGHQFRIYADDHWGDYPIIGAVIRDGQPCFDKWTAEGRMLYNCEHPDDLIPRPQTVWINVYREDTFRSEADADKMADHDVRLACIEVPKTWED